MTLCIAATCHYQGETAVVCCCDESSTRDNVTSQDTYKMEWLGDPMQPSINVLLAGRLNSARELLQGCRPALMSYHESKRDDLAVTELLTGLREVVGVRRAELNDQYLVAEYALRFKDFLAHGQQWFSAAEHDQIWKELKQVGLFEASLIISSFTDGEALIIEVTEDGRVTWAEHFAVQGTGARLANAFLQQRDYNDFMELEECLFRVFEAKQAAEKAPFVGKRTITLALLSNGTGILLNAEDFNQAINNQRQIPQLPKAELATIDFTEIAAKYDAERERQRQDKS